MFDEKQWQVIEFVAEEVRRQYNHPHAVAPMAALAVPQMLSAWELGLAAKGEMMELNLALVQDWAHLIEPTLNQKGHWRNNGVLIGYRSAPNPVLLNDLMQEWHSCLDDEGAMIQLAKKYVTEQWAQADEWNRKYGTGMPKSRQARGPTHAKATQDFPTAAYFAFEHIHPFSDGNGRTGKLLYCYLRDELESPTWPVNIWGIGNP